MSSSSTKCTDGSILVGTLGRPHGLQGEITIQLETDNGERFVPGHVIKTDTGATLTVREVRQGPKSILISFEECPDRNTAEQYRGSRLLVGENERRELGDGEYWPEDLIGLEARSATDSVGTVTDVIIGDAQDRLVVDTGERKVEIPLVIDLVPEVDLEAGIVTIHMIDGLV